MSRHFKKDNSVFQKWREDTKKMHLQALAIDSEYWKIKRFVKDEDDQDRIYEVFVNNFGMIKDNFLYTAASSNFA